MIDDGKYHRDIEEPADSDGYPLDFWKTRQKELLTCAVDYNLGDLAELVKSKAIDLTPAYQRRFRWDGSQKSKLIESFLMHVPIPPIFLNENKYGQYSVIDGKQRLLAISEFFQGSLKLKNLQIFSEINGAFYDDLPLPLQRVFRTRSTLRAIIVLQQSDIDLKFEAFQRLNTGSARLNSQEIRTSIYPSSLNTMILELSVDKRFHRLLSVKSRERSPIYKEMRDAELVLRYLAFRDTWQSFSGSMKRHMDHYMYDNEQMSRKRVKEAREDFLDTLATVEACFGEYAFQCWVPASQQWRPQALVALYDAEMFACKGVLIDKIDAKREKIIEGLKTLFLDDDFRRAIEAGTNYPAYFRTRVLKLKDMLHGVLGE